MVERRIERLCSHVPLLPLFLPLLMVVDRLLLAQGKPLMGLDLDMGKLLSLLHLPMLLLPMLRTRKLHYKLMVPQVEPR